MRLLKITSKMPNPKLQTIFLKEQQDLKKKKTKQNNNLLLAMSLNCMRMLTKFILLTLQKSNNNLILMKLPLLMAKILRTKQKCKKINKV